MEKPFVAAEVNLAEDALYIVKGGALTKVSARKHGKDLIVWKNGQVLDIDRNERVRIEGQELI